MAKQVEQITLKFNADISNVKQAMESLNGTLNAIQSSNSSSYGLDAGLKQAANAAKILQQNLQAATNVNTGKLNFATFSNGLKAANTDLHTLTSSLSAIGPLGKAAVSQLTTSLATAEMPVKKLSGVLGNFAITLKNAFKWELSSRVVHGIEGAIQGAISYAEDLNKTLTSIQQVSNQSFAQMQQFTVQANTAAKALATTTKQYANASLIYFQQGDSAEAAAKKAEITLKAVNSAFTANAEEMSSMLTATWNAYQAGTDQLEHYVDVMAALGANTATSLEEIATALQKVAATANTTGVSMEKMSAMIATISSTTRQAASTVGTSMNTILNRMSSLKLGETLEDGVDLTKYTNALKTVGVDVLDATGNLRDMGNVIEDLGARWQTLSTAQKTAVAQTIGGVRQYTNMMALFENWNKYQQNLDIAANSKGQLQRMQDIYSDSIEGSKKRVKAAKESIYEIFTDDKVMTSFNNGLAKTLELVEGVLKGFGGLPGILTQVALAMNSAFGSKIQTGITNMVNNLGSFAGTVKQKGVLGSLGALMTGRMPNAAERTQANNLYDLSKKASIEARKTENTGSMSQLYAQQAKLTQQQANLLIGNRDSGIKTRLQTGYNAQQLMGQNSMQLNAIGAAIQNGEQLKGFMTGSIDQDSIFSRLADLGTINLGKMTGGVPSVLLKDIYQQAAFREYRPNLSQSNGKMTSGAEILYGALVNQNVNAGIQRALGSAVGMDFDASLGEKSQIASTLLKSLGTSFTATKNGNQMERFLWDWKDTKLTDTNIEGFARAAGDLQSSVDWRRYQRNSNTYADTLVANAQGNGATSEQIKAIRAYAHEGAGLRLRQADLEAGAFNPPDEKQLTGWQKAADIIGKGARGMATGLISGVAGFTQMQNAINAFNTDNLTQKISGSLNAITGFAQAVSMGGPWGAAIYAITAMAGAIVNHFEQIEKNAMEKAKHFKENYVKQVEATSQEASEIVKKDNAYTILQTQQVEGIITQTEFQDSLVSTAENLGIQGAAVLALAGNYQTLQQEIENTIDKQEEQTAKEANRLYKKGTAQIGQLWDTQKEESTLKIQDYNATTGYRINDVLSQIFTNDKFTYGGQEYNARDMFQLYNNKDLAKNLQEKFNITIDENNNDLSMYEILAQMLGVNVAANWGGSLDDIILGKDFNELYKVFEGLNNLQEKAYDLGTDTDFGKWLDEIVNSRGFDELYTVLTKTVGTVQSSREAWQMTQGEQWLKKESGVTTAANYSAETRKQLVENLLGKEFFNVEIGDAGYEHAKELAEQLVDNYVSGLKDGGAEKSAEAKLIGTNYNKAKKEAEKMGISIDALPNDTNQIWKYTNSAMAAKVLADAQDSEEYQQAILKANAYQTARSALIYNNTAASNNELNIGSQLENWYDAISQLGQSEEIFGEYSKNDLSKLGKNIQGILYGNAIKFFQGLFEEDTSETKTSILAFDALLDEQINSINTIANQKLLSKAIEDYGANTIEELWQKYSQDTNEDRKEKWAIQIEKNNVEQKAEQVASLRQGKILDNVFNQPKSTMPELAKDFQAIQGMETDLNKIDYDKLDSLIPILESSGHHLSDWFEGSDLDRNIMQLDLLREKLEQLKNSDNPDQSLIDLYTIQIDTLNESVNNLKLDKLEEQLSSVTEHWKEVEDAATNALNSMQSHIGKLGDMSFGDIESLRENLLAAGIEADKVSEILDKINNAKTGKSDNIQQIWDSLSIATTAALASLTANDIQLETYKDLTTTGKINKIDASEAIIEPDPIPVSASAQGKVEDVPESTGPVPTELEYNEKGISNEPSNIPITAILKLAEDNGADQGAVAQLEQQLQQIFPDGIPIHTILSASNEDGSVGKVVGAPETITVDAMIQLAKAQDGATKEEINSLEQALRDVYPDGMIPLPGNLYIANYTSYDEAIDAIKEEGVSVGATITSVDQSQLNAIKTQSIPISTFLSVLTENKKVNPEVLENLRNQLTQEYPNGIPIPALLSTIDNKESKPIIDGLPEFITLTTLLEPAKSDKNSESLTQLEETLNTLYPGGIPVETYLKLTEGDDNGNLNAGNRLQKQISAIFPDGVSIQTILSAAQKDGSNGEIIGKPDFVTIDTILNVAKTQDEVTGEETNSLDQALEDLYPGGQVPISVVFDPLNAQEIDDMIPDSQDQTVKYNPELNDPQGVTNEILGENGAKTVVVTYTVLPAFNSSASETELLLYGKAIQDWAKQNDPGVFSMAEAQMSSWITALINISKDVSEDSESGLGNARNSIMGNIPTILQTIKSVGLNDDGTLNNIAKNLLDGLKNAVGDILSNADWTAVITHSNLGDPVEAAFKEALDIQSPSKLTMALAPYLIDGLQEGLSKAINGWEPEVGGLAGKLQSAFVEEFKNLKLQDFNDYVNEYLEQYDNIEELDGHTLRNIKTQAKLRAEEENWRRVNESSRDFMKRLVAGDYVNSKWSSQEQVAVRLAVSQATAGYTTEDLDKLSDEELSKMLHTIYTNIDKAYTEIVNRGQQAMITIKSAWIDGLGEIYSYNDKLTQRALENYEATFQAFQTARKGLLNGEDIYEALNGDAKQIAAFINGLNGQLNASSIMQLLLDPNQNANTLLFESLRYPQYNPAQELVGDKRFLNQKDGYISNIITDKNGNQHIGTEEELWAIYQDAKRQYYEDMVHTNKENAQKALEDALNTNFKNGPNATDEGFALLSDEHQKAISDNFKFENGSWKLNEDADIIATLEKILNEENLLKLLPGGYGSPEDMMTGMTEGLAAQIVGTLRAQEQEVKEYAEAVGYTKQEFKALREEMAAASDGKLSLSNEDDIKQLNEVTYAAAKYKDGLAELQKITSQTWSTMKKEMANGTKEGTKNFTTLKSSMAKIFNVDANKITNKFVTDHLAELQKMATGTKEQVREAEETIQDDLVAEIIKADEAITDHKLDPNVNVDGVKGQMNTITDFFQNAFDQWDNKELGFTIDAETEGAQASVISAMNAMLESGQITADGITAALNAIGWDPKIEWEPYTTAQYTSQHLSGGYQMLGGQYVPVTGDVSEMADMTIYIPKIKSASKSGGGGKGPAKSGGGGGGRRRKDRKDDEDKQRYHQIDRAIGQQNALLEKNEKLKTRKYGNEYLNALKLENAEIKNQIGLQKQKYAEAKGYLEKDTAKVLEYGATFDEMGNINYEAYMDKWIAEYNAKAELFEANKMDDEAWEKWEKEYKKVMKAMENYEDSQDKMNEIEKEILELQNSISSNLKELAAYKLELKLDLNERQMKLLEVYLKRYEHLFEKSGERLRLMVQQAKIYGDNLNAVNNGLKDLSENAGLQSLDDINSSINGMLNDGQMSVTDFTDGLKDLQDKCIDNINSLIDLRQQMIEYYGKTLDEGEEKLSKFTDTLNHHVTMLEKYREILDYISTGPHFEQIDTLLQNQANIQISEVEVYKERLKKYAEEESYYEDLLAIDPDNTAAKEALEDLKEKVHQAEEDLVNSVSETMKTIQDIWTNTSNKLADELNHAASTTGDSLESLQRQWDFYKEDQEFFVDKVTQVYEIDKLTRKIEASINESRSKQNQQQLKQLEDEIKLRSRNNELSEYDIEMMNLSYELLLKRQDLENGKNAKTQVRLTRDENGNMIYQYTTDQDRMAELEQSYNDTLYQMNQKTKEYYEQMTERRLKYMQDETQALQELWSHRSEMTTEEFEREEQRIKDHYNNLIGIAEKQLQHAQENMEYNQLAWNSHMDTTLIGTAQNTKEQLNIRFNAIITDSGNWEKATNTYIDGMVTGYDTLQAQIAHVADIAEVSYEKMLESVRKYREETDKTQVAANQLLETIKGQLLEIRNVISGWTDFDKTLQGSIVRFQQLAESIQGAIVKLSQLQDQQKQLTSPSITNTDANGSMNGSSNGNGSNSGGGPGGGGPDGSGPNKNGTVRKADPNAAKIIIQRWGAKWKSFGTISSGQVQRDPAYTTERDAKNAAIAEIEDSNADPFNIARAKQSIETYTYLRGGSVDYTGPAWLDGTKANPEYILNAKQTHEMFEIINSKSVSNLLTTMENATRAMLLGLTLNAPNIASANTANNFEQTVTINAEFPSAKDHNEIKLALQGLVNKASQYANRLTK